MDTEGFLIHYLSHEKNHQTQAHAHLTGQLYVLQSGMICGDSKNQRWSITPNCLGWIPMNIEHRATSWGNVSGWCLYLPSSWCNALPNKPCLLTNNQLINALIARIVTFTDSLAESQTLSEERYRIIQVLIDEIKHSQPINSLLLPYPTDPRLIKITQAIWHDPTLAKTQQQWANWVGMSVRSLSRYFSDETGMTFSHWKQLAKVMFSLEKLTQGQSITEIVYSSGFSDASAYIASFKAIFGVSPKRYFNQ